MDRRTLIASAGLAVIAGCQSPAANTTPTPDPAAFVASLDAPDEVQVGGTVPLTVEIVNTGGQAGRYETRLARRI